MHKIVLSILILSNVSIRLCAQCPITVNAGPDKLVCNSGLMVTLDGSIGGDYLGFRWTPTNGLSNANTLTPSTTVSGMLSYVLSAGALDPAAPNLVNNPGFENGNTGFTSNYAYNPLPISPGLYTLTTSPSLVLSSFPPCDDHTYGDGTGQMMLVNGNGSANTSVWCQNIAVMPNTWYAMSAWAAVSPISPPVFQFNINNTNVGPQFPISFAGCTWQQFSGAWYSGTATTAAFCIKDVSGSGNGLFGDDYVLDDIYFAKACSASDTVKVGVITAKAVLPASVVLPCTKTVTGIQLNGSASSSGPGFIYSWSGPGILSGGNTPVATVNEPGEYTLTVSYDTGSGVCSAEASIQVVPDPNAVEAMASAPNSLTCTQNTTVLSGAGSSTGGTISYSWSPSGNVVSGGSGLMPTVNAAGEYILTVSNLIGNCTATASATVSVNNTPPLAVAAAISGQLSCNSGATVTLNGSGSAGGPGFSYSWSGPGIVSGANTLNNCLVNVPGTYVLTVSSGVNGCTATASTQVQPNSNAPIAVALPAGTIKCGHPNVEILSTGSSTGANFTYQWTTANGLILGKSDSTALLTGRAGLYTLAITNTLNGCVSLANALVKGDTIAPKAQIIPANPPVLTCNLPSFSLASQGNSPGKPLAFQWFGPHGVSSDSSVLADTVGQFILKIRDTLNGCFAQDTITIFGDFTQPDIQIEPNPRITCAAPQTIIHAQNATSGSGFSYQWSSLPGNIVAGEQTLTPLVAASGIYKIQTINNLNGCISLDSVLVALDTIKPNSSIAAPAVLTCKDPVQMLQATFVQNTTPSWSYNGGAPTGIVSGDSSFLPVIQAGGTYRLHVLDTLNGCLQELFVSVSENKIPPTATVKAVGPVDCSVTTVLLDGSGSTQGANIEYLWSNQASTVSTQVTQPGLYTLQVLDLINGCKTVDSVFLSNFGGYPQVDAGTGGTITCSQSAVNLQGSGDVGPQYAYLWTFQGSGSGILSGANSLTSVAGSAGKYFLHITNVLSGCAASDSVQVDQAAGVPIADAGAAFVLTCGATQVSLDASGSSMGLGYGYTWSTTNGNLVSGIQTLNPVVDAPGDYILVVTDLSSNCTATDLVTVSKDSNIPQISAGISQNISCKQPNLTLNGSSSVNGAITWSTNNGNIVSGGNTLHPIVDAPGIYQMEVVDLQNNCSATASVFIGAQLQPPLAIAAAPDSISCSMPQVMLSGAGSSSGANFSYSWTGPNVVAGDQSLNPSVAQSGVYTLMVLDNDSGCTSTASVTVLSNNISPIALAAAPIMLDCAHPQVPIDGAGSSNGNGIGYLWTGPGIFSGVNTLQAIVNQPGIYSLTVLNLDNGCSATAMVTVMEDKTLPIAMAAAPTILDCTHPQVQVYGTGSTVGAGLSYTWTGPGILNGGNSLQATVQQAGIYSLMVLNSINGCSATASVTVLEDKTQPIALASAPDVLNCTHPQVQVNGSGSTVGSGLLYTWMGPGILSGGNSLQVTVQKAGVYSLTVLNSGNGCSATASVAVLEDKNLPIALAAASMMLDCTHPQVQISGSGSTTGPGVKYQWIGPGIMNGGTTIQVTVNQAGIYSLTVLNSNNGCTAVTSVAVSEDKNLPIVIANAPAKLDCAHPQVQISGAGSTAGAGISYQWMGPGIATGGNDLLANVSQPGIYTLIILNENNGCTAQASLQVFSDFALPDVNPGNPIVLPCNPPMASLSGNSATSGVMYNWDTSNGIILSGGQTPAPVVGSAGTYRLTVSNPENGCSAQGSVVVSTPNPVFPQATTLDPDCRTPVGSISFSGAPNVYVYSIDGGQQFSAQTEFPDLAPGTYQLVVRDSLGCEEKTEQTLNSVLIPEITMTSEVEIQAGNTYSIDFQTNIPASEIAFLSWSPALGLSCTDCLQPLATPDKNSVYQVLLVSSNGCADSAQLRIRVKGELGFYVPNVFDPGAGDENAVFRPFTKQDIQHYQMQVFDRWGNLLFESQELAQGWDGMSRGQKTLPGVYAYVIRYQIQGQNGAIERRVQSGDLLLLSW